MAFAESGLIAAEARIALAKLIPQVLFTEKAYGFFSWLLQRLRSATSALMYSR
jgi:hypothetical protein